MDEAKNIRIMELSLEKTDITYDDEYRLKLSSKKLKSGKCQVKFYATLKEYKQMYGYVLVDSDRTLKDVVVNIKEQLSKIRQAGDFHHLHLYSIGKSSHDMNFMIFDQ